jgi:hypothetical protein
MPMRELRRVRTRVEARARNACARARVRVCELRRVCVRVSLPEVGPGGPFHHTRSMIPTHMKIPGNLAHDSDIVNRHP